jgi:DNA-binding transcriptional regulator YiaG
MTPAQLRSALGKTGFTQVGFARVIKVSGRTVRGWISGQWPVPTVVGMLLNLMLKTGSTEKDLRP